MAARGLAAVIAIAALAGLAAQFQASLAQTGSAWMAAWAMFRYFTIIANLLVGMLFAGMAVGGPGFASQPVLGGATIAILLVGVIYGLLLRDLVQLSGAAKLADLLLHHVTPILAPLYWVALAPKGALGRLDPLIWSLFPLGYFAYALVRGAAEGLYAYPFMDIGRIGWNQAGLNALAIGLVYVAAGYVVVWLDGRLAFRRGVG